MNAASPGHQYEGIVVLGMPRSGTTLVAKLLGAHPRIHCAVETNLLRSASRFLREEPFSRDLSIGVRSGLNFWGYGDEQVIDSLRQHIFSYYRDMRDRAGKRLWAEKTAFDAFHLPTIGELCDHHCRYVAVVRHGLDVVCSLKELADEMEMYMDELHGYVQRYASPYEAFAHAWSDVNCGLLRFVQERGPQAHWIRYEELVADPGQELQRLLEFLGEPADVDELCRLALCGKQNIGFGDWKAHQASQIYSSSVDRWRQLSESTVNRLARIVEPTLQELGYAPVELRQELDPSEARRRHAINQMIARMRAQVTEEGTGQQWQAATP
jgi:hypothetical protein